MANPVTAPATPLEQKTQTAFISLQVITSACHAILNTEFIAPDPKPSWFDDLNKELDAAKAVAATWVNTISPKVTGGIPLAVLDFGPTYAALTQSILKIADDHPTASGKDNPYVKQVQELVTGLHASVQSILTSVDDMTGTLEQWGEDLQTAHDNLDSGAVSIQALETDLATDITKMNTAIKNLNEEIAGENTAIAVAAAAIGIGLLLLVAGIALAPETGGASLVVAFTGGVAVIGGAITWGVMQDKINKQLGEIGEDTKELNADKRQLVALKTLGMASNSAISALATSSLALSDFRTSWDIFAGELQGVLTKLDAAENSLSVIVQESFTEAASQEWAEATTFAQDLSESKIEVQSKTTPIPDSN